MIQSKQIVWRENADKSCIFTSVISLLEPLGYFVVGVVLQHEVAKYNQ